MRKFLYNLATDKYTGLLAGIIKFFLFLLSLVYGLMVKILIYFHLRHPYQLNCKVISVGNITLGGTGKTSLVELIAKRLSKEGKKVVVLSRGYKRKYRHYALHVMRYDRMGDEPYMLQLNLKNVPVLVNADRIRIGKRAIRDYNADTVILDDGLQQWKIKKDLEIVTIDAICPFGNRHLIPRGILRQPLNSLKHADIFVLTKTNLQPEIKELREFLAKINPRSLIIETAHIATSLYRLNKPDELLSLDLCKEKNVTLISGIGDPGSFERLVVSLGIKIGLAMHFADHHPYSQKDLKIIAQKSIEKNISYILTTEKDAVRLRELSLTDYPLEIFVLRIELKIIKDEKEFFNRLFKLYKF